MTELLNAVNEFFKTPLGVILLSVLAALGAGAVSRIRARADVQNKIEASVAASEEKTKELAARRETQYLTLIDDLRTNWTQSQQDISELRQKYQQVVERNIQLVSEQRASLESVNKLTDQLEACNRDADKLHADFQTMLDRLDALQNERNETQAALVKRNGEYEELDAALKKRNAEFVQLSTKFENQKKEIEHLQADLWETKRDLAETKERLTTLESKPDTGSLDASKVPPTDPALSPAPDTPVSKPDAANTDTPKGD